MNPHNLFVVTTKLCGVVRSSVMGIWGRKTSAGLRVTGFTRQSAMTHEEHAAEARETLRLRMAPGAPETRLLYANAHATLALYELLREHEDRSQLSE